jgi:hypothetical protein
MLTNFSSAVFTYASQCSRAATEMDALVAHTVVCCRASTGNPSKSSPWLAKQSRKGKFTTARFHYPVAKEVDGMTQTDYTIFALTPDKQAVYHFHNGEWIEIGGPASQLYGGDWGLVATNPGNGDLWKYLGVPGKWEQIGGPGASFAVTNESVYGLTPNKGAVFRYNGSGQNWTQIGGPAGQIYGGSWGVLATNPSNGELFAYQYHDPSDNPEPASWNHIGGPGSSFAVGYYTVYGLTPDKSAVWRYDDGPWTKVGGPADSIVAALWIG